MESIWELWNLQWIETARGRYAVVMQRDGRLLPETETLLRATVLRSGADLLYADAAIETLNGISPVYKPDYAPDTLLSYDYVGSPMFLSERLYARINHSLNTSASPADRKYMFTVRAMLLAEHCEHIPHLLFVGAKPPMPTSTDAVRMGLSLLGRVGAVAQGPLSGSFSVRYAVNQNCRVSVIIRNNGNADALRNTMESFELRNSGLSYEFIIAAGDVLSERELHYCGLLQRYRAAKLSCLVGETNDARIKNAAAAEAGGEYLLFLDAGTEPNSADAVERMISHAQQKRTGAVGGILQTERGERLQAELTVNAENIPVARKFVPAFSDSQAGATSFVPEDCIRNVTLLGSPFLLRTDVFFGSGGFDETFDSAFCEAALSLSLSQRQYFNVCTPQARFLQCDTHQTSLSRRNRERCTDVFRALRIHGDPKRTQNAEALRCSEKQTD